MEVPQRVGPEIRRMEEDSPGASVAMKSRLSSVNELTTDATSLLKRRGVWIAMAVVLWFWFASSNEETAGPLLVVVGAVLLYFLPSLVARKKPNANSVFVINLFFGWTLFGWVIALAMAVNNPAPATIVQIAPAPSVVAVEQPTGRTCPFCAEDIRLAAVVCKHCGRDLPIA